MPLEFPTVPLLFFPHWRHCHSSLGNSWLWDVADFPCLRSLSGAQEDCLGSSDCSSATASLMLGVGSRSLWRRLQRKSFLIPWAHTVGSASQARPGLAGFYTILFPFLPHSTLQSIEGSCHGVCKREHRRDRGLRGGLKFYMRRPHSSPTYLHSPTSCVFIDMDPWLFVASFRLPRSSISIFCVELLPPLMSRVLDDSSLWQRYCSGCVTLTPHCGHQGIVGDTVYEP